MEPAYRNGLYLANLATSSGILMDSYTVISKTQGVDPVKFKDDHPDCKIIAIVSPSDTASDPKRKGQLVPIPEKSDFHFLRSANLQSLLINEAALDQFVALRENFLQLQEKINPSSVPEGSTSSTKKRRKKDPVRYIITGRGLDGSVASLLTLWLLNRLNPTEFNLLCITFGSPLLGDTAFQQAVSRHPTWNSCFLHVVHKDDCVPRLYLVPPPAGQSPYEPFGTFLLCSESGGACFQAPESIIELLKYQNQGADAENQESQPINYENVIKCLEEMHYDSSFLGYETDSYKAGITVLRFGNELYLASLAVSSNLLKDLWNATFKLEGDEPVTVINDHPDYNIIAIVSSPVPTSNLQQESSLAPESEISGSQFRCSDPDPYFWINKAAFSQFASLRRKLSQLLEEDKTSSEPEASSSSAKKNEKKKPIPYIITGRGLNGSVASLFTRSLLSTLDPTKFKLQCITFGSPPLWDTAFQPALCPSTWNSCFLHVLHKDDWVRQLFVVHPYKPLGIFLLCSESGIEFCQDPESVIERLKYENPEAVAKDQTSRTFDYKDVLECLDKNLLERDYEAGVTGQVTAVGLLERQQQDGAISALIKNIVAHEKLVLEKQRLELDPAKLAKKKAILAKFEWYIYKCRNQGLGSPGYYDSFKDTPDKHGPEATKFRAKLDKYWKKVVEDAEKKPQLPNEPLRKRWLFAGTNYRRIVEPLHIAEYYGSRQRRDYMTRGRSKHYERLEKWLEDHQKATEGREDGPSKSEVVNVTEDSCFWAHVEEAILSLADSEGRKPFNFEKHVTDRDRGGSSDDSEGKKPFDFKDYVMDLIEREKVSSDIFLEESSYMQWWRKYREILNKKVEEGSHPPHHSKLVNYMTEGRYKDYGEGPSASGDPQG